MLLDGGTRSRVYWVGRGVYMGVYYANLHIYPPQISCVRQLIKTNIVYKDRTGMTNHMITSIIVIGQVLINI